MSGLIGSPSFVRKDCTLELTGRTSSRQRRSSGRWRSGATITAITVACLLVSGACREQSVQSNVDVTAVDKDIREHLPIGSSRADVAAYLDQRKITHSYVRDLKESPENSHTEMAMIRGNANQIVRQDIQILFKFDNTDTKLVNYSVRPIFTGP